MARKYLLFIIGFAICIQISTGEKNENFKKCEAKLMEQLSQIKFGRYPKCFDASKLHEIKKSTETLQELFKTVSKNCMRPDANNIKGCLKEIHKYLESKSKPMQAEIIGAIHTFFEAVRGCVKSIIEKVTHFDQWVLAGCPDELKLE